MSLTKKPSGLKLDTRGAEIKNLFPDDYESWESRKHFWVGSGEIALLEFILIANPEVTAVVIPFMNGFWAVFYCILLTAGAFSSKKFSWALLIALILTIILGIIIMFNPIIFGLTITIWIGITLLFVGIANVAFSFDIKKIKQVADK